MVIVEPLYGCVPHTLRDACRNRGEYVPIRENVQRGRQQDHPDSVGFSSGMSADRQRWLSLAACAACQLVEEATLMESRLVRPHMRTVLDLMECALQLGDLAEIGQDTGGRGGVEHARSARSAAAAATAAAAAAAESCTQTLITTLTAERLLPSFVEAL
eukprot:1683613-Pleurochrysis_carterae.AAC.1